NLAFRASYGSRGTGEPAFWFFLAFYAVCVAVTLLVYLRTPHGTPADAARRARPARRGAAESSEVTRA
ncbi:hypothetical protein AB0K70_26690, partial [Streptomyces werraensis]